MTFYIEVVISQLCSWHSLAIYFFTYWC